MVTVSFTLLAGIGIFTSVLFTRMNGPFNVFAHIRKIGKPFTCSVCMAVWSVIVTCIVLYFAPPSAYLAVYYACATFSAIGWAFLALSLMSILDLE